MIDLTLAQACACLLMSAAATTKRGGVPRVRLTDGLKKTLNAFKNPQLKKKSAAVSLCLRVNGAEYLCGSEAKEAGAGASGDARGEGRDEKGPSLSQQSSESKCRAQCLWDYVLSDAGQDCFPLWFEVEEEGRKSVVMGAVFYFPIGEASEEETAPRREVRVDMPSNSTESELKFATLWMGRWLPGEAFVPPFMTYDNHKRPLVSPPLNPPHLGPDSMA